MFTVMMMEGVTWDAGWVRGWLFTEDGFVETWEAGAFQACGRGEEAMESGGKVARSRDEHATQFA